MPAPTRSAVVPDPGAFSRPRRATLWGRNVPRPASAARSIWSVRARTAVLGMGRGLRISATLLAACLVGACLQYVAGWNIPAASAPAISVSQNIPAQTLIGRETPVELTFTNGGEDRAFNLAFWVRLPLGVSVSSADQSPSSVITETNDEGDPVATVVAWENIVDIVPGGRFRFRYSLAHEVGNGPELWAVGETINTQVEAFVSDQEAVVPQVGPSTGGDPITAEATQFTQTGSDPGSTTLVPLLLTKSEPSAEAELLRGVHDHQTVYTITVETGSDPSGVDIGLVEDWIPAGLEFLGCGTEDNSPTEEYPGAGPLNPGHAPALTDPCLDPELVETVDSGLPPGLSGVYTHVVWDIGSNVPAETTTSISYVAGIPQRENTLDWPNGEPLPATGNQGSNLGNNTGPFTTQDGQGATYTNQVQVDTTFQGTDTVVEDTETVQAVDLSVHKFVDSPEIQQGAVSTWQLYLETSEYVVDGGVANLALEDITPDGTCPIGSANPRCTATQPDPVPPYTDTTYNQPGPGQTTLEWDLGAETLGPNETFIVSFATEALDSYANGAPVSANDSWTNTVDLTADVTTFGPGGPDDEAGYDLNAVLDDSSADQSGTAVSFRKDVGRPADGQGCGDGTDIDWNPDSVAGTGPGDRVCFRLTADPPASLDTIEASMTDFLPPGLRYEDGSATAGPDNEVPPEIVEGPLVAGQPATGQRIDWNLLPSTSVDPAEIAQVVFAAILDGGVTPDLVESGEQFVNSARVTYENTSGEIFVVPDNAVVELTEAHLDLVKGISETDPPAADPTQYPFPTKTVTDVVGGTAVTYTLRVTNDGTSDAIDTVVRDLLPVLDQGVGGVDATCDAITFDVEPGEPVGDCIGNDVVWTGLTIPAGGSVDLHYTWMMPDPVPVAVSWTNIAGVVEYHSTTNTGTDFEYVPRDNIDPSREPDANTDPAIDAAHVFSPGISMTKTRTTAIDEPGNAEPNQATIGEVISFTVESRQSANTTASNYDLADDLAGRGLQLVPGSVEAQAALVAPGAPCDYTGSDVIVPGDPGLTVVGEEIHLTAQGLNLGNQDGCAVPRFDAIVQDELDPGTPDPVPPPGTALPVRPDVVWNAAELTFDIDVGGGPVSRTISAQVDTQVVEPNIAIEKRAGTTGTVLPGTEVTYQLVVTNVNQAQVSTAHDLTVTDDFSGSAVAQVADPGGGTVAGNTITWTLPADADGDGTPGLAPGASLVLTYTVQLQNNLQAGATLSNTAEVVTSSLLGEPDPPLFERTDGSDCSPGACPGYIDDATAELTVGGPSITKTVTSRLHTFGEIVTYDVKAFFPAHLDFGPDVVTISDNLAGGATRFLDTVNAVCTGCSDAERAQYEPPEENGTGTTDNPRWDLAVFGASNVPRRVFLSYRVRIENNLALSAGATLPNIATLDYTNDTLTDDAVIEIAEPQVSLVKRVGSTLEPTPRQTTLGNPVPGEPGGTITYQLAVTNDGNWTAYNVEVTDEPDSLSSGGDCAGDSRLTFVGLVPDERPTAPLWDATDTDLGTGDACLGFEIPALLPGDTAIISYELAIPDDFPREDLITGPEFVNTAAVPEYFGLAPGDRVGHDEARIYPDEPITDEGHVNLAGGALGDLVWLDLDGDGQGPDTGDTNEPGIAGVTVTITGPSGTLTRVTNANGRWLTDDGSVPPDWLVAGNYTVTVDTTTLPPGLVNSADPDGGLDSTAQTALAENEVNLDQDFGYTGDQSLGDTVWLDLNADGIQDAGEPGIPGVDLAVVWAGPDSDFGTADDVDFGTFITDPTGEYLVTGLPEGPTRVTVDTTTLPTGVEQTFDLDEDLDNETVRTLDPGENALDVDFGYAGTATVGDTVWLDFNADGDQGTDEPGIPGVDLDVTWAGFDETLGTADDVTVSRTTDADGLYLVENLPAGQVRVSVVVGTLPGGLTQTFDPDPDVDDETVRTLTTGQEDLDADFGYAGIHEIGDLVWLDVNANGLGPDTGEPAEPGVPGQPVTVLWAGADGDLDTDDDVELPGATTGADGRWLVSNVPDGDIRVMLDGGPAATLTVTADPEGALDGIAVRSITADDLDIDFGLAGTGSVGDLVWFDFNADGVVDPGEPPIPGVDVAVTWAGDDGELGTPDDVDYGTVTTGLDGLYLVSNLPPGDVRVTIDPATVPPGLVPTYDYDGGFDETADRTLEDGEDARDVDFGYRGEAEAGDYVWWDLNADGVQDADEPGIPGVRVTLDWAGFDEAFGTADDGQLVQRTDADGGYLFTGLPAGDFRVTVGTGTLPDGVTQTFDPDPDLDSSSPFTLAAAESNLDLDFGYAGDLTLGDLVWGDVNRDEGRQRSEPALGGVGITVTYLGLDGADGGGDDVVVTTRTTPTGGPLTARQGRAVRARFTGGEPLPGEPFYLVPGLVPGAYVVELDTATLPNETSPLTDRDGGDPAVTTLRLDTESVDDADFGVFRKTAPDAAPAAGGTDCGVATVIDPTDGVVDLNGDQLSLVPGSIKAPDGVEVEEIPGGDLRLTPTTSGDKTVTWTVSDGRGGTAKVTLVLEVDGLCATSDLPGTGSSIVGWWIPLAVGLILLGALLIYTSRRRRA